VAESMLHALEGSLRIFEEHRNRILDQSPTTTPSASTS
jgi:hypothetical protein